MSWQGLSEMVPRVLIVSLVLAACQSGPKPPPVTVEATAIQVSPTPTRVWPPPTATPLPIPDNVSAKIGGAAGGMVEMVNGSQVEVPPGALDGDAEISIRVVNPPADLPIGWGHVGHTYNVDVKGATVNKSLRLLLPIPEGLPKNEFDFHAFHWNGKQWIDIGGEVEGNRVTFLADSFSSFEIGGWWKPKDGFIKISSDTTHVYVGGEKSISVTGNYVFGLSPLNIVPLNDMEAELKLWLDRTWGAGNNTGFPQIDKELASKTIKMSVDLDNPSRKVPFAYTFSLPLEDFIGKDAQVIRIYATVEFLDGIWSGFVQKPGLNTRRMSDLFALQVDRGSAMLQVTPNQGGPEASFVVSGFNFDPGEAVRLTTTFPSESGKKTIQITSNEHGYFQQSLSAPKDAKPGQYDVIAVGTKSGADAAATWTLIEAKPEDSQPKVPQPPTETKSSSRCLTFGSLPPLNLVLSTQIADPVTVVLPVVDKCKTYPPDKWIRYPWMRGIKDIRVDAGQSAVIVAFSSASAAMGYYEGKIGVRYPGETEPIWAPVSLAVTEQGFALPADFYIDYQETYSWGKNNSIEGNCTRDYHSQTVGVEQGRIATAKTGQTKKCSDGSTETKTWERQIDLFTGRELGSTCTTCASTPFYLGPRPGGGTQSIEILGKTLRVFIVEEQESEPESDGWQWIYSDRFLHDEATGVWVGRETTGRLTRNGKDTGTRMIEKGKITGTNLPLGGANQSSMTDLQSFMSTWLTNRCNTHRPARYMDVLVQLTDKPKDSFGLSLDLNGQCQISDQSMKEADIVMTIASSDLVKLLEGSISYGTLVSNGRISVKYSGQQGPKEGRGFRNDFLEFLLQASKE